MKKTIKFKIVSKNISDVTDMTAKGWRASVFRDLALKDEFVVISKDRIKFNVSVNAENKQIVVDRYIDGKKIDYKRFHDTGNGINGMIFIVEDDEIEKTYAFFRTEELQDLIETYHLHKVIIAKQAGDVFELTIPATRDDHAASADVYPTMPPFHTDGTFELDSENNTWHIANATYVYDYQNQVLTIPQVYDPDKLFEIMESLIEN